ncbi:MAG: hypothetical protein AB7H43_12665 [Acidimicrobiia bacterium]
MAQPDPSGRVTASTPAPRATSPGGDDEDLGTGGGRWVGRARRSVPALQAGGVTAAAALLAAALAPRGGGLLALLAVPAGLLAGLGGARGRVGPGAVAFAAVGASYCSASASNPVDVTATSIVAAGLFAGFQLAVAPGETTRDREPTSIALLLVALASGPIVLVVGRGMGGVGGRLYLPALAAAVAAVAAPVLLAARRARDRPD